MSTSQNSSSLQGILDNNEQEILKAMEATILATTNSVNPFGRGKKLTELKNVKRLFENDPNVDNLIDFVKKASEGRPPFFSTPNSATALQTYDFLDQILSQIISFMFGKIKSKEELNSNIVNKWFASKFPQLETITKDPSQTTSDDEFTAELSDSSPHHISQTTSDYDLNSELSDSSTNNSAESEAVSTADTQKKRTKTNKP